MALLFFVRFARLDYFYCKKISTTTDNIRVVSNFGLLPDDQKLIKM